MNWEDEGFVIEKRRFRENAIILDVFTNKNNLTCQYAEKIILNFNLKNKP